MSAQEPAFNPRDAKWKRCLLGCRPAADVHRSDCPNAPSLVELAERMGYTVPFKDALAGGGDD